MDPDGWQVGYDKYWRQRDYQNRSNDWLRATARRAGYLQIPSSARKADLVAILHRIDRQRLIYYKCNVSELRKFAIQRRLTTIPTASDKNAKKQLVQLLESADDVATFSRFLDLSAELRCLIYEHYVAEFPKKLHTPAQPPIAKVNKLLRTESLPIFYKQSHFRLEMWEGKSNGKWIFKFSDHSRMFLSSLAPESLADFQSLNIELRLRDQSWREEYDIEVQLKTKEKGEMKARARCDGKQDEKSVAMEKVLFDFFNQESQRKKKLAIEDVYAARRKLEDALIR